MAFIGNQPTAVPLTSSQLVDGIITTSKLAADAVTSAKILDSTIVNADIASTTINLTQKVTGTLPVANGGTGLTALGTSLQVLRTNTGATALEFATVSSGFTSGTPITASGTSITFSGIPSTAKMIVIGTDGLSFTGAGNPDLNIQIGDSGGIETTGYKATAIFLSTNSAEASPGGAGYTDAFVANYQPDQSTTLHCQMILTCLNTSTNTWNFSNLASAYSAGYIQCGAGVKSLSDTLTQIKISYSGGQSFDAGTINIMYI